jgi:hypothetical protein
MYVRNIMQISDMKEQFKKMRWNIKCNPGKFQVSWKTFFGFFWCTCSYSCRFEISIQFWNVWKPYWPILWEEQISLLEGTFCTFLSGQYTICSTKTENKHNYYFCFRIPLSIQIAWTYWIFFKVKINWP